MQLSKFSKAYIQYKLTNGALAYGYVSKVKSTHCEVFACPSWWKPGKGKCKFFTSVWAVPFTHIVGTFSPFFSSSKEEEATPSPG